MAKIDFKDLMKSIRFDDYKSIIKMAKIYKLGANEEWKQLTATSSNENEVDIEERFSSEIEEFQKMEYLHNAMLITLLSEYWEQDLFNFLREKGKITNEGNVYKTTKASFEKAYPNIPLETFPKIEEMRELVNAIKHGKGNSLDKVKSRLGGSILADSQMGTIKEDGTAMLNKEIDYDPNTLTSKTLNLEGKLEEYYKAVIDFWKKVYSEDNLLSQNNVVDERDL